MKVTGVLSSLLLILPLLSQVSAQNDNGRQRGGNQGGNQGQNQNQGGNRGQNRGNQGQNNQGGNQGQNNQGGNQGQNNQGGNQGQNNQGGNQGQNNQGGNQGQNNQGGNQGNQNQDPQTSLTLDPRVIAPGFANNGQDPPVAGQVASLTSTNNFINFCLTVPNLPITDGKQIETGSCNPAPIGVIPNIDNMPSSKFSFPTNNAVIPSDEQFTIRMNIRNLVTGNFVNAQENYFAAPQQLNNAGQILGHSHVVAERLQSLTQTTPTNPREFAFFKGLNGAAQNGELTAEVTDGLAPGAYRLCSINTSSNHQPVIVPVAQHGALDDCVYFTAAPGGVDPNQGNNNGANQGNNNGGNQGNNNNNNGANQGNNNNGGNQGNNGGANQGNNNGGANQGNNNGANQGNNGGANQGNNGGANQGNNNGANQGNNGGANQGNNNGANQGNNNGGANQGNNNGANQGRNNNGNNGQQRPGQQRPQFGGRNNNRPRRLGARAHL